MKGWAHNSLIFWDLGFTEPHILFPCVQMLQLRISRAQWKVWACLSAGHWPDASWEAWGVRDEDAEHEDEEEQHEEGKLEGAFSVTVALDGLTQLALTAVTHTPTARIVLHTNTHSYTPLTYTHNQIDGLKWRISHFLWNCLPSVRSSCNVKAKHKGSPCGHQWAPTKMIEFLSV